MLIISVIAMVFTGLERPVLQAYILLNDSCVEKIVSTMTSPHQTSIIPELPLNSINYLQELKTHNIFTIFISKAKRHIYMIHI